MQNMTYFGQTQNLPGNEKVNYPINSAVDAQNYSKFVNSQIPSSQIEYGKRRMLKWLVPERGVVEMYINPQSIKIAHTKNIKPERSKGGFVIQYWGEDLIGITISGNTGSSGIEGINVLMDIYRGEQLAFDIIAIEQAAKSQSDDENFMTSIFPGLGQITDFAKNLGEQAESTGLSMPIPTLGAYASTVEMYWMGEVYRGFFENFSFDEDVSNLGLFTYNIGFKATQKRGIRTNYLPWHHSAISGPSDHGSIPYSFGNTITGSSILDAVMAKSEAQRITKK